MEDKLTIAEVASLSGLSVHTLRYYERSGLLEAVGRDEKGHRSYSAENVRQITFYFQVDRDTANILILFLGQCEIMP